MQEYEAETLEQNYAHWCYLIEKETGQVINEDYLAMKFVQQRKEYSWYVEQEKKAYSKNRLKR